MSRLPVLILATTALALSACSSKRAPMTSAAHEPMARANLYTTGGEPIGLVSFSAADEGVAATVSLHGLTPYSVHGLHVHEGTTCSGPQFAGAGGHLAPDGDDHGSPVVPEQSHAGDLGNIAVNGEGRSIAMISRPDLELFRGEDGVVGRTVVLHSERDDVASNPSGYSGDPMACGVVQLDPSMSPEDFERSVTAR